MKRLAKKFLEYFLGPEWETIIRKEDLKKDLTFFGGLTLMDYLLVGATGFLVGYLRFHQFGEGEIFLILWAGNLILSGAVVIAQWKTGIDMTLMERLRRVLNFAIGRNRVRGLALESLIIIRLIVWNGPDQFILFFHERLRSKGGKITTFILASAIQMAVWTWLYSLGYDSFTELFRAIIR